MRLTYERRVQFQCKCFSLTYHLRFKTILLIWLLVVFDLLYYQSAAAAYINQQSLLGSDIGSLWLLELGCQ
jgi:hypothetical protein